ncbi:MAG: radical SAM protein [Candidatus Aenigmarchaeota archaeon]|nr:radical SAM protein [Candidatus Aenigmarchaeota archaeon]
MKRYYDVCDGRLPARFLIAKTIKVDFSASENEKKLWKIHTSKMKEFREKLKTIDTKRQVPNESAYGNRTLVDLKLEIAKRMLESCEFCERKCSVNRKSGEKGFCSVGETSYLSSQFLHMGEERCLIPSHTFFFIGCNFYCVYCQNYTISRQIERGHAVDGEKLAEFVREKAHISKNVNLVGGDPIPHLHTIIEMLKYLEINKPIIWNSNMYMTVKSMKLLEGLVDVYLADFKYGNNNCAERLSKVKDYWDITTRNLLAAKMHADVIVRHLVLPGHVECCSRRVLEWLGKNLKHAVVNVMDQYHPEFEASKYDKINRYVTEKEMSRAFKIARKSGIKMEF